MISKISKQVINNVLRRPHLRAWPPGHMAHIADVIGQWLKGQVHEDHRPDNHSSFADQKDAWLNFLYFKRENITTFSAYRSDGPDDDPWAWLRIPLDEDSANQDDLTTVDDLIKAVGAAKPPPHNPAMTVVAGDPRDGDGWDQAVARQGIRVPSYREGYLESTHWKLLEEERLTGTCTRCHRTGRTHLHHVTYANLGAETEFDTRELCAQCHRREHPRVVLPRAA